jgi:predicted nucleotidyltransferase
MNTNQLAEIIEALIPSFRNMLIGKYAIALGGSHSKGYADAHSDVDFYVYTEDVIELSGRKRIIENITNKNQEIYKEESWPKWPTSASRILSASSKMHSGRCRPNTNS